jgi:putative ABC transport system permease protein
MYTVRAEAGPARARDPRSRGGAAQGLADAGDPGIDHARQDRKDRYRADVALSWMLVTVSVLLLLITASGIVGMASLWVTQRRKQIGVRRALGASRGRHPALLHHRELHDHQRRRVRRRGCSGWR